MLEKKRVYYCNKCHNIVEALWNGNHDIDCCAEPMKALEPNTIDASQEKHVPVIERNGNKLTIKIGEVPHPMTPEHYILFIEVVAGNRVYRYDFVEGDTVAEATFLMEEPNIRARAFCNLHGFWETAS